MKKVWTGKELLESEITEPPKLIQSILWKGDNVIILGDAKAGKSLFSLQLLFSLTSQHPLFDVYEVYEPQNVLYIQAEGKMAESISRFKKMSKEVKVNPDRVRWIHLPNLPLDRDDSFVKFCELVETDAPGFHPDVVFFDPLYKIISGGSLSDDDVANRATTTLDRIKMHYNATIILNHHEHRAKTTRDEKGAIKIFKEFGDSSIFGSFIWRAWPDHILHWKKDSKLIRSIECSTQRSGGVEASVKLFFNEPDPLFFEINEDTTQTEHLIRKIIESNSPINLKRLKDYLHFEVADSTLFRSLRRLRLDKKIIRDEEGNYHAIGADKSNGS